MRDAKDATQPTTLAFWVPLSGLNASKFRGKGWEPEVWTRIFGYDLELQVAQHVLDQVRKIGVALDEKLLAKSVCSILTSLEARRWPSTLAGLQKLMFEFQRSVELPINELPMNPNASVQVHAGPGKLLQTLANGLRDARSGWESVRTVYMFDELELIPQEHQEYLQSLVREITTSATVILGSRLHGLRTLKTLTGEENREGSEFRLIELDTMNANRRRDYRHFAKALLVRRLSERYVPERLKAATEERQFDWLQKSLLSTPRLRPLAPVGQFAFLKPESATRPYFAKLRTKLRAHLAPAKRQREADEIIDQLAFPDHPLLEKANILIFYRSWAGQPDSDLMAEARKIRAEAGSYISGKVARSGRHREIFDKYADDLAAQIYREDHKSVPYAGLTAFIEMSEGNPRNLINLLYHAFAAARFHGEQPFEGVPISIEAQRRGVNSASEWFITDAIGAGDEARAVTRFLDRLGNLMREVRFADKPYESSCSAFSVDVDACSAQAQRILDLATGWSLLLRRSHKDKNSKRIIHKFQISGMLAPRWDLPIHRRGTFALLPPDVDKLCSTNGDQAYADVVRRHLSTMTAPFSHRFSRPKQTGVRQDELF